MRIRHGAKALRFKGLKNLFVFQAGECISDRVLQLWLQIAAHRPGLLRIRLRNLKDIHLIETDDFALHQRFEDWLTQATGLCVSVLDGKRDGIVRAKKVLLVVLFRLETVIEKHLLWDEMARRGGNITICDFLTLYIRDRLNARRLITD